MQGPLIIRSIHQASLKILILKKLSLLLSSSEFLESISKLHPRTISLLQKLLGGGEHGIADKEEEHKDEEKGKGKEKAIEEGKEKGKDKEKHASAALFLLQSIASSPQLMSVLQSREVLAKLGLVNWLIPESIYYLSMYILSKSFDS